jgi:putative SOS response-associated peptidase YedK
MCNLVTLKSSVDEVASHFKARRPKSTNTSPGEVYPGGQGFVVREQAGELVMDAMSWGFPVRLKHMKPTSKPKPVNNARDDKLLTFWRQWFTNPAQRCLIPISAFAEAEGEKGRMTRTWISVADQPLAACAGLWRPSDEWGDCYTMVMVDATEELWDIHDRMPVILHPHEHEAWLRASAEEAMALVRKYPADRLIVDRTDVPWFKPRSKQTEGPTLI